jgi:hypothetical protein
MATPLCARGRAFGRDILCPRVGPTWSLERSSDTVKTKVVKKQPTVRTTTPYISH